MNAFHSFWSLPNTSRNYGEIGFPDFELLTAMLSVFTWKKHSGSIKMITDSRGAAYFKSIGLGSLWDEIDTSLDEMDEGVDPIFFWAAGKLHALKSMELPCVMLDTDIIFWKKPELSDEFDVIAAHDEALADWIYPNPNNFWFKDGYRFPEQWDFSLKAANTAFLYMKNEEFRDTYVNAAQDFFRHVYTEGLSPTSAMCFGEQRILPMCAKAEGVKLGYLMRQEELSRQDYVTHTWGLKQVLSTSWRVREELCMRMVSRIMKDFPEKEEVLKGCPPVKPYYDRYMKEQ